MLKLLFVICLMLLPMSANAQQAEKDTTSLYVQKLLEKRLQGLETLKAHILDENKLVNRFLTSVDSLTLSLFQGIKQRDSLFTILIDDVLSKYLGDSSVGYYFHRPTVAATEKRKERIIQLLVHHDLKSNIERELTLPFEDKEVLILLMTQGIEGIPYHTIVPGFLINYRYVASTGKTVSIVRRIPKNEQKPLEVHIQDFFEKSMKLFIGKPINFW